MTDEEKAFYKVMIKYAGLGLFCHSETAHTEITEAFERAIAKAKTPTLAGRGVSLCQKCGGQVSPASPPE